MVIGCSILDDSGAEDYQPLYLAARMGAVGGPIAAFFCLLVSGSFTLDEVGGVTDVDPAIVAFRARLDRSRAIWGLMTPYVISVIGSPVGSAILQAGRVAPTINPLSAVRAGALGGVFAAPIYYILGYTVS